MRTLIATRTARQFGTIVVAIAGILTLIASGGGGGGGGGTPDTTAPTVVSTIPRDTAAGIFVGNDITVTFSESIDSATITSSTFTVGQTGVGAVAGTLTVAGDTVTFNPDGDLTPGAAHDVQITTGVTDLAGNPLATTFSWSFTTENNGWQATDNTDTDLPAARTDHTAVWTGTEMIVWGGSTGNTSGGRYDPAAASGSEWQATSTTSAPTARTGHTAVWTGTEMIVWGGSNGDTSGGRYDPAGNSWQSTPTTGAPTARTGHTAVWTGSEMIIWGGTTGTGDTNSGALYDPAPAANSWQSTSSTNPPAARTGHTAVWTGTEMIVWGGEASGSPLSTGGRYDPATDTWTAVSNSGAPAARFGHTAVWTGTHMIVWGGTDGILLLESGAMYDPATNTWQTISTTDVPAARSGHTAVWTGDHMIVWGGSLNSGGRYDPAIDAWKATTTTSAPSARTGQTAIWSGSEMIVWGGTDIGGAANTGGRYTP